MILLQILGVAVLLYAFCRTLKAGWDAWLESFNGFAPPSSRGKPGPRLVTSSPGSRFPGRVDP